MAARFMPRVGPSRETRGRERERERERREATRRSATMLFSQRLLQPLLQNYHHHRRKSIVVESKGPKRRMKRRRESASVQTYSSPREYKVNRPPLQCSGTNLVARLPLLVPFFFVNRNGILRSPLLCSRPSAAINLFFSLSLSLSFSFPSLFFLFFFYAAHQSFLLAFLFSLLASRPFSRRARTHARTHVRLCTTRLCNRVYSSMTPHASSRHVLAYAFR